MQLIQHVGNTAKMVYKTHIIYLDEPKQQVITKWAKLDHIIIAAAFVIGIISRSRSVMHVLYTFLYSIPYTL